jgi:hypothetical protein
MDRIKPRERATRPTTLWAVAASTPGKPEMDDLDTSLPRHRGLTRRNRDFWRRRSSRLLSVGITFLKGRNNCENGPALLARCVGVCTTLILAGVTEI